MYMVSIKNSFSDSERVFAKITLESAKDSVISEMKKMYKESNNSEERTMLLRLIECVASDVKSCGATSGGYSIAYDISKRSEYEQKKKEEVRNVNLKIKQIESDINRIKNKMSEIEKQL